MARRKKLAVVGAAADIAPEALGVFFIVAILALLWFNGASLRARYGPRVSGALGDARGGLAALFGVGSYKTLAFGTRWDAFKGYFGSAWNVLKGNLDSVGAAALSSVDQIWLSIEGLGVDISHRGGFGNIDLNPKPPGA